MRRDCNCVTFMQLSGMWIVKMDSKNAARFDPESWLDSDQPVEWIREVAFRLIWISASYTQKRKYADLAFSGKADKRPSTDQCHLRQWQWVSQKALARLWAGSGAIFGRSALPSHRVCVINWPRLNLIIHRGQPLLLFLNGFQISPPISHATCDWPRLNFIMYRGQPV
jgi:hypothetical protein